MRAALVFFQWTESMATKKRIVHLIPPFAWVWLLKLPKVAKSLAIWLDGP